MKIRLTFDFDDMKLDAELTKEKMTREQFAEMIKSSVLIEDKDTEILGATVIMDVLD